MLPKNSNLHHYTAGAMASFGDMHIMTTPVDGMLPGTRVRLQGRTVQFDTIKTHDESAYEYGFRA